MIPYFIKANIMIAIIDATHDGSTHVSLISGGGAGHEPAHAAFVGPGLLTAVVSGNVFASPSVPQIVNTIRRAAGSAGVVLIIKNYTGDVFHFLQAAQKVQAVYGLAVETVVVGDDVAVGRKMGGKVGRRGLAGTVLVHKILGAMAASGSRLQDVAAMGRLVAQNLVTISASLNHVHVPGRPVESHYVLRPDEIELGMGIHNEPGCKILSPQPRLDDLLDMMLGQLFDMGDTDRAFVDFKDAEEVVLLVNNLGGMSALEISAMTTRVVRKIGKHNPYLFRRYQVSY
jgi:dihydroxyacetone kinase